MRARDVAGIAALSLAAAASWYLAGTLTEPEVSDPPQKTFSGGFYLRSARILGTGDDGDLLYEINAEYAEQMQNETIQFQDVQISYSPDASIPWTLSADSAVIGQNQQRIVLSGNVRAVSANGFSGEATEIRTPHLVLLPESFRAETDKRVQIRIGSHSLTATGMLALLEENQLQLKSNVSGKFVP